MSSRVTARSSTRSISRPTPQSRHCARLDRDAADARLSDRLRHGARAAALAAASVHADRAAVLDVVPDPRLCLDDDPATRRLAQPGAARARHRRCAAGVDLDRHRDLSSASSIPICRSWCCRSTPRSRRWTRPCSRPPPISAARAGRRSGWSRCRWRCRELSRVRSSAFIPIVGEFVIPDLLGGSDAMMIGQTLWTEFFSNRDWPAASAVAVVLLALLIVPMVIYQHLQARRLEREAEHAPRPLALQCHVALALRARVPLSADPDPGDLFVQCVAAGHGVGRLVDALVCLAARATAAMLDAAWISLRIALSRPPRGDRARHARGDRAGARRPLPRTAAVLRASSMRRW